VASGVGTPEPRHHQGKFLVVYVVLAVILGAAVTLFLIQAITSDSKATSSSQVAGGDGWSPWVPAGPTEAAELNQIADHVGARYRLPNGHQLITVRGQLPSVVRQVGSQVNPVEVQSPVTSIAVPFDENGRLTYVVDSRLAIEFGLCGADSNCAIPPAEGPPTEERGQLLQRAATELALYTFANLPAVEVVVAIWPADPGGGPTRLTYFDRSQMKDALSTPLAATLDPVNVPEMGSIPPGELEQIHRYTGNFFSFRYQIQLDGQIQMVLQPVGSVDKIAAPAAGG
jgi:hypothetical protein